MDEGTLKLDSHDMLSVLKAAAEPTRLRVLALLAASEHNVTDLTRILGQSQPRISRHLKLLAEAGLVERVPEGSWVFFHLTDDDARAAIVRGLLSATSGDDPILTRDRLRADAIRREREQVAHDYFERHAAQWDRIRALHAADAEVETAILAHIGEGRHDLVVDLGTGTGRMLELISPLARRLIGIDVSQSMLAYARTKIAAAGLTNCTVRHGDLYNPPVMDRSADIVVMHQVLHFLTDPARAVREAVRILKQGGRLLIVDFAPHELEFLRKEFAHERLGFSNTQIRQWMTDAGVILERTEDLAPTHHSRSGSLTVSLWLGAKVAAGAQGRAPAGSRQVEAV